MSCRLVRSICLMFALMFFGGMPVAFGMAASSLYYRSIASEEREAEEKESESETSMPAPSAEANLCAGSGAGADSGAADIAPWVHAYVQLFRPYAPPVCHAGPLAVPGYLPHSHGMALLAYLATWRL